jgi:hypothetical protein
MGIRDYMAHAKAVRNRDKIFNAGMYTGIGFALGTILCLHKDKEEVQVIAGTILFFLLATMLIYKWVTRTKE